MTTVRKRAKKVIYLAWIGSWSWGTGRCYNRRTLIPNPPFLSSLSYLVEEWNCIWRICFELMNVTCDAALFSSLDLVNSSSFSFTLPAKLNCSKTEGCSLDGYCLLRLTPPPHLFIGDTVLHYKTDQPSFSLASLLLALQFAHHTSTLRDKTKRKTNTRLAV